jgi:hypothetical protein
MPPLVRIEGYHGAVERSRTFSEHFDGVASLLAVTEQAEMKWIDSMKS